MKLWWIARIYDNLGVRFTRLAKGIYRTIDSYEEACILLEGDGRDLSMFKDSSIDCILTDHHPWLDMKSNKGGTRAFAVYDCFKYSIEDFKEKARVLKEGCFLVEILPAENENNYEYYMSGCSGMLPTMFDVQPVSKKDRIHQSELPASLCEQILQFVTYEGEVVLDSFAGSGVVKNSREV